MKVGLYFGTFNPIHIGHLIIANHVAEYSGLDEVWMVVTPHNPLKKKNTLLADYQRLQLVRLATEAYPKIKASDFEFKLSQPNYTINTLTHLQEKHPKYEFSLIMGEDNLRTFHKWKNYKVILENYSVFVYPRIAVGSENLEFKNHPKIHLLDAPIVEISATFIRENIKKGKNVTPLMPDKVAEYIDYNNLYQK